jgi:hypothetical protein
MAIAVGADGNFRIGELLDFFGATVAGSAFVFVERHRFSGFLGSILSDWEGVCR